MRSDELTAEEDMKAPCWSKTYLYNSSIKLPVNVQIALMGREDYLEVIKHSVWFECAAGGGEELL